MAGDTPKGSEFIVHNEPVWRARADFIIAAELEATDLPRRFEQLWARKLGEGRFEICCIPFFLFDVALGDVVETHRKGGREYVLKQVVQPSDRYVFRVWFGDSFQPREEIASDLLAIGALIEWSSVNLLAVDAADHETAQTLADFLSERQEVGQLLYETGKTI